MLLKRTEFLGDKDGKSYIVDSEEERIIIQKNDCIDSFEYEKKLDNALDSFEDGYNVLKQDENNVWYEVQEDYFFIIKRKIVKIL